MPDDSVITVLARGNFERPLSPALALLAMLGITVTLWTAVGLVIGFVLSLGMTLGRML